MQPVQGYAIMKKTQQKGQNRMAKQEYELFSMGGFQTVGKMSLAVEPLLAWYRQSARVLPWRSSPTPYHVWLSEIMLQQTRVEAVIPYYHRFLDTLPDIPSLAEADEEQLHKLWEGLGYYSRVRNFKKAAVQVVQQYNGMLPPSYELLLKLCGIGEYTAGAIASIAFGIPVPAVDGNVLRVVSRLLASEADIAKPQVKSGCRSLLAQVIPQEQPGNFNQAMMELGATVCLPNGTPKCGTCPLSFCCDGFQHGNPMLYPVKAEKKPRKIEAKTIFLIRTPNGVLLRKRPDSGLLAGLWEFPNADGQLDQQAAVRWLEQHGIQPETLMSLKPAKHIFTHVEWQMTGYLAECSGVSLQPDEVLADMDAMKQSYSVPSAFAAYKGLLFGNTRENAAGK